MVREADDREAFIYFFGEHTLSEPSFACSSVRWKIAVDEWFLACECAGKTRQSQAVLLAGFRLALEVGA